MIEFYFIKNGTLKSSGTRPVSIILALADDHGKSSGILK
jgi:hypothetical protein